MKKTGKRRSIHVMLLSRMSSLPKTRVGRSIAWERLDARRAFSTWPLQRKYDSGESALALVMLMCTTRRTPAALAAVNRVRRLAAALVVGQGTVGDADPVGVEEGVCPFEASRQCIGVVEVEGQGLDGVAEGVRAVSVACQRAHMIASLLAGGG